MWSLFFYGCTLTPKFLFAPTFRGSKLDGRGKLILMRTTRDTQRVEFPSIHTISPAEPALKGRLGLSSLLDNNPTAQDIDMQPSIMVYCTSVQFVRALVTFVHSYNSDRLKYYLKTVGNRNWNIYLYHILTWNITHLHVL